MSNPKKYIVKITKTRAMGPDAPDRFIRGTKEEISRYCGKNGSTLAVVLNRWNKELDFRYACTYTRSYVDVVESVPEGTKISELGEK